MASSWDHDSEISVLVQSLCYLVYRSIVCPLPLAWQQHNCFKLPTGFDYWNSSIPPLMERGTLLPSNLWNWPQAKIGYCCLPGYECSSCKINTMQVKGDIIFPDPTMELEEIPLILQGIYLFNRLNNNTDRFLECCHAGGTLLIIHTILNQFKYIRLYYFLT